MKLIIHMLGFLFVGIGLALSGINILKIEWWIVMFGISVIYFNAVLTK